MSERWGFNDYYEWTLSRLMRFLPLSWVSAMGAGLGARASRKGIAAKRLWVGRLRRNFARYLGITDPREGEQRIIAYHRRLGRIYAECPHLPRLVRAGRFRIDGLEHLASHPRPSIVVTAHVAHWELIVPALGPLHTPMCYLYDPPMEPAKRQIVMETRQAWPGDNIYVAATDPSAMRQMDRAIREGRTLVLFIDEEKSGVITAPRLGRPASDPSGNLWYAARLAVKHRLPILSAHIEPTSPGHYRAVIDPALAVPATGSEREKALMLAAQMEDRLNGWVTQWLEHWYWLPFFEFEAGRGP